MPVGHCLVGSQLEENWAVGDQNLQVKVFTRKKHKHLPIYPPPQKKEKLSAFVEQIFIQMFSNISSGSSCSSLILTSSELLPIHSVLPLLQSIIRKPSSGSVQDDAFSPDSHWMKASTLRGTTHRKISSQNITST